MQNRGADGGQTLLECHAVGRAARSANRDVRTVRAAHPPAYSSAGLLECRAVRRAAGQRSRDLHPAEAVLAAAARQVAQHERVEWNRLEVAFHRAINDLSANFELAELTERIHRTVQGLCARCLREPLYRPEQLQLQDARHALGGAGFTGAWPTTRTGPLLELAHRRQQKLQLVRPGTPLDRFEARPLLE